MGVLGVVSKALLIDFEFLLYLTMFLNKHRIVTFILLLLVVRGNAREGALLFFIVRGIISRDCGRRRRVLVCDGS